MLRSDGFLRRAVRRSRRSPVSLLFLLLLVALAARAHVRHTHDPFRISSLQFESSTGGLEEDL